MSGDDLGLTSYEEVAAHYRERWGREVQKEWEWYGPRCRSLAEAIKRACLSQLPSGRGAKLIRHPHQRRIPGSVLAEAARVLSDREVKFTATRNFDDVFNLVNDAILAIPGVGELLVYDVAHRIGGFLGHVPQRVYLHTGTREGACALGLSIDRTSIELNHFPRALHSLRADQLEDVLCIYRATLTRLQAGHTEHLETARGVRRCR